MSSASITEYKINKQKSFYFHVLTMNEFTEIKYTISFTINQKRNA